MQHWTNQNEAPGTVLCHWNIQHQKRPCRQCFFLFWFNALLLHCIFLFPALYKQVMSKKAAECKHHWFWKSIHKIHSLPKFHSHSEWIGPMGTPHTKNNLKASTKHVGLSMMRHGVWCQAVMHRSGSVGSLFGSVFSANDQRSRTSLQSVHWCVTSFLWIGPWVIVVLLERGRKHPWAGERYWFVWELDVWFTLSIELYTYLANIYIIV
jgi:hypothetical protein